MYTNVSGYKFIDLTNLVELRQLLWQRGRDMSLKGTIYLSEEGINIALSGDEKTVRNFISKLELDARFQHILWKFSQSKQPAFQKWHVKIRKEIITTHKAITANTEEKYRITPQNLREWLDQQKDFNLLDVRNHYETYVGTFTQAKTFPIENFSDFFSEVEKLPATEKQKPAVVFCTGGVRCEKVVPYMLQQGFNEVYQLDGGILNYFAECGGAHYKGDCFVFDDRISIDPNLKETSTVLCTDCQFPILVTQQHCTRCEKLANLQK